MLQVPGCIRAALLLLAFALLSSPSAFAVQRTFVSTAGSDSNTASNCSNTAPCRGFAAALTVTDSGGEIIVKDSGGYGPVTIAQSVSIIAPEGVYAGISVLLGNGITIATAGVNVVLRGLSINGLGGSEGVYMNNGLELSVESCHVSNFPTSALHVAAAATVRVLRSVFIDNDSGIRLEAGVRASVEDTQIFGGGIGVWANSSGPVVTRVAFSRSSVRFATLHGVLARADSGGTSLVSITRSVASNNGSVGYYAYSDAATVRLKVKDSEASENNIGVDVASVSGGIASGSIANSLFASNASIGINATGGGVTLTATGNTVTNGGTGLSQSSGATFESTGDNIVRQNTTPTAGTITAVSKL